MGRFLGYPVDARPQKGAWAPGDYLCKCTNCDQDFVGDKRALCCAECAYNNGWRLIENAPKDGRHILVANIHNAVIPPTTVHWFVDPKDGGGWHLSVNQLGEYSDYVWGPPTHWKPAPQPPQS